MSQNKKDRVITISEKQLSKIIRREVKTALENRKPITVSIDFNRIRRSIFNWNPRPLFDDTPTEQITLTDSTTIQS